MAPNTRVMVTLMLMGLLLVLFVQPRAQRSGPQELRHDQFVQEVDAGRIRSAEILGDQVTATTQDGQQVRTLALDPAALGERMRTAGVAVTYGRKVSPWWMELLVSLLPGVLIIGLMLFMFRAGGVGGQAFQVSRSRATLYKRGERRVTMSDVAGVPEAKDDLMDVVDFLRHPEQYTELGARVPRGVILAGPPGTGKTLLARAVAGEAGVAFFSLSGSEFVEMFAGVGAARVRDLFTRAKAHKPAIIFIDEIDAVGRHRGVGIGGGNEEREQTLNQLLVEMDGFSADEGIIVMAATNRVDILDPALLRPGRFDRHIHIDPPDRQGRLDILTLHAREKRLAADVELEQVAALTVGFTGADLANLLNEAALMAARHRRQAIAHIDLENAFERIITGGPERRRVVSRQELERVAFHEAGHALVSRFLPHSDPIQKVTILPRGRAGGYVLFRAQDDRRMQSRIEILDRLAGILAGRAAEEVTFGNVSTGAASDLAQATDLVRRMVTQWGMSEELGPMLLQGDGPALPAGFADEQGLSDRTAGKVDRVLRAVVSEAYERARQLLLRHRDGLERVARALLDRETISGTELNELLPQA